VTIHDACEADLGLELIERCRPDVVVLDADLHGDDADAISRAYHEASSSTDADLVILGKLRKDVGLPSERVIAKPYHFAPLVRTIEALLAKHSRESKAVALRAA
jgi:DNA-binding response OmpR family regulator